MPEVDVLIITALKEEFDAAYKAGLTANGEGGGVAEWNEVENGTTPYLYGEYLFNETSFKVALARPTRMGSTSTAPITSSLVDQLKPTCLAMCGVCAGNPSDVSLGDVIIAEMTYTYDEGKKKAGSFEGDHRQVSISELWLRKAQNITSKELPSFSEPTEEESNYWLFERLYYGDDPRRHLARPRYFSSHAWREKIHNLEEEGSIVFENGQLKLTQKGKEFVEREKLLNVEEITKLPFEIKVGPMASSNAVVKDGITWQHLTQLGVRSIIGLEMEASTIANSAYKLGVPEWIVVKGVMDHADPNKDDRYKSFAAKASAEVLFSFLENSLEPKKIVEKINNDVVVEQIGREFHSYSQMVLRKVQLLIPGIEETLPRNEVGVIEEQLQIERSILLLGDSGTGKTGIAGMLISSAIENEKNVLFLDARSIKDIKDESQLRKHLSLPDAVSTCIEKISNQGGLRLVIDQLDSVIGLAAVDVLISLALYCDGLHNVEVIVVSRHREGRESRIISQLTSKNFYPIESRNFDENSTEKLLLKLGIDNPPQELLKLAQNFLNLELIGRIKQGKPDFDFSNIDDEITLWKTYVDVLTEREGYGTKVISAEKMIADAVDLAKQGLLSEDGKFTLDFPTSVSINRLISWQVVEEVYGRTYRFGHEKLQDYFYAWDATQRNMMPRDVIEELGQYRSRNVLEWIKQIYRREFPELHIKFLEEALEV